jgi:O-antigen/teichoic acid export membrane protein
MRTMKKYLQKITNDNHMMALLSTTVALLFTGFSFLFFVRTYSKHDLGEWILYTAGLPLLEMLRAGMLYTATVKFLSGNIDSKDRETLMGATWILAFLVTALITGCTYIIFFLFKSVFIEKGFLLFFNLFPLSFVLSLPLSVGGPILISNQDFKKVFITRLGTSLPVFLFSFLNYTVFKFDLFTATLISALMAIPIAIYCLTSGLSGIQFIFKATKKALLKIVHYGKYTMFTLLGAQLLRSSDAYIIGLFLTNIDVANYGIPLSIASIIEKILGSVYDVAMPSLSKENNNNNLPGVRKRFYKYVFFITILIAVAIIPFLIFQKPILWIFSGNQFINTPEVYAVLTVFVLSFLMHPIDRFCGITLDSINKPAKNLFKVVIMVTINIAGDILAVIIFKSIVPVALVTLMNLAAGGIMGVLFLKKEIKINFRDFTSNIKAEVRALAKFRLKKNVNPNAK